MSLDLDFDVYAHSEEEIDSLDTKQSSFWKRLFQAHMEGHSSRFSAPRHRCIGRTLVLESEEGKPFPFMEKHICILTDLFFVHVLI